MASVIPPLPPPPPIPGVSSPRSSKSKKSSKDKKKDEKKKKSKGGKGKSAGMAALAGLAVLLLLFGVIPGIYRGITGKDMPILGAPLKWILGPAKPKTPTPTPGMPGTPGTTAGAAPGSAPAAARPNAPASVAQAVTGAPTAAASQTISFEFERTTPANELEKLQRLRKAYTFLRDSNPIVLTLSDKIKSSKAKEILVFPYPYVPGPLGSAEQTSFGKPATEIKKAPASVEITAEISPDSTQQYHTLTVNATVESLENLKKDGSATAELRIKYQKLFANAVKADDDMKMEKESGAPYFPIPIIVWYNPCKTTEAELLPFDKALEEIADCYAAQAQLENAEFHERYWDNKKKLEKVIDDLINDDLINEKPVRFANVAFSKEILGAFENGWEASGKAFTRENNLWKAGGAFILKDRYDVPETFKTEYDTKKKALNLAEENKAQDSIAKAQKAAAQHKEYLGTPLKSAELFGKQLAVLNADNALLRNPFDEQLREQYATKVAELSGNAKKEEILASLDAKYGTEDALVKKLDAENTRLETLIKVLEAEKTKADSDVWSAALALKQPLASLKPNNAGKAWAAVAPEKEKAKAELDEKIKYLQKQKAGIKLLIEMHNKEGTSSTATGTRTTWPGILSSEFWMAPVNKVSGLVEGLGNAIMAKVITPIKTTLFGNVEEKKAAQEALLAAYDNPVVDREIRARRYLQQKYWLKNIGGAYAFYDLVHAIEEDRDTSAAERSAASATAATALQQAILAEFSKTEKTRLGETAADGSASFNNAKVLKSLEEGKIKELLEEYATATADTTITAGLGRIGAFLKFPLYQKEFGKLALVEQTQRGLIEELVEADGKGEVEITEAEVLDKQKLKELDSKYVQKFESEKLFKRAFNYYIDLILNYSLADDSSEAKKAKEIAARFSKHMDYVAKEHQTSNTSSGTETEPETLLTEYKPLTHPKYGEIKSFFRVDNKIREFISTGGTLMSDEEAEAKLKELQSTTKSTVKKEKLSDRWKFTWTEVLIYNKQQKEHADWIGETVPTYEEKKKDFDDLLLSFGDEFYAQFKDTQTKAKPDGKLINFVGITYAEPIADLSAEKGLVAGYAGLLAKETNDGGTPKYSKAPSKEKNSDEKKPLEVFKAFLFELNEFLPKELNPNALAAMVANNITKENAASDARAANDPAKAKGIAEPKLLALRGLFTPKGNNEDNWINENFGFGAKAIFEPKNGGDGIAESNALLEALKKNPEDTQASAPPAADASPKNLSITVNEKQNKGTSTDAQCGTANSCIVTVSTSSLPWGSGTGKIVRVVISNAGGSAIGGIVNADVSFTRGSLIANIATVALARNKYDLELKYGDSYNYKLKKIKVAGGSSIEYSLASPITIEFLAQTDKGANTAVQQGSGYTINLVQPIPLTFTPSAGVGIEALNTAISAKKKQP